MMDKKVVLAMLAVVIAVALGGCSRGIIRPVVSPGGPIIVVQPGPDPEMFTASSVYSVDYTHWYVGCPIANGLPPEADKVGTYRGIPRRFGDKLGAEKIVVTLNAGHKPYPFNFNGDAFNAKTIELGFHTPPDLTIELQAAGQIPTWKLSTDTTPLKAYTIVPRENFSHYVYGHITTLKITDTSGNSATVDLADLKKAEIRYYQDGPGSECP